jgi:hypothetical protein
VADISAGTYTDAPPAANSHIQFPPSKLAISHSSIIDPQTKKITAISIMQASLLADVQLFQHLSNQNLVAESAANSNQHPAAEPAAKDFHCRWVSKDQVAIAIVNNSDCDLIFGDSAIMELAASSAAGFWLSQCGFK